jgi:hypothetical protein
VSLPTLLDVDWRLDVKKSSNELARMNVPTVLVGLEVCQPVCLQEGIALDRLLLIFCHCLVRQR